MRQRRGRRKGKIFSYHSYTCAWVLEYTSGRILRKAVSFVNKQNSQDAGNYFKSDFYRRICLETTADREIRLIIAAMQHCRAQVLLLDRALRQATRTVRDLSTQVCAPFARREGRRAKKGRKEWKKKRSRIRCTMRPRNMHAPRATLLSFARDTIETRLFPSRGPGRRFFLFSTRFTRTGQCFCRSFRRNTETTNVTWDMAHRGFLRLASVKNKLPQIHRKIRASAGGGQYNNQGGARRSHGHRANT